MRETHPHSLMNSFSHDPMIRGSVPANNSQEMLRQAGDPADIRNLGIKDMLKELTTVATSFSFSDDNSMDYDTNSSQYYLPVSARVETFVMSAVLGIIFIVGVLGNGTLIAIFLRHRGMRNIPNT